MAIFAAAAFVLSGFCAGVFYSLFAAIRRLAKNFVATLVLDLVWCFVAGICYIWCVFGLKSGEFAFFEAMCFVCGVVFEIIFVQNIFASFFKWVYTQIKRKRGAAHDPCKTDKLG